MQAMHITSKQQVACQKCGHVWTYKGKRNRISCAKCRTSITLFKQQRTQAMRLPLKVIDSIAFSRAIGWAKTNGQDYVELQSIIGGVLSLA